MTKGFTLIELLVVIAVIAILSTVVVVVLNPAQILAESRDMQRISDLDSVKNAFVLTLATATTTPTLVTGPLTEADLSCGFSSGCPVAATSSYAINSTGWVGINFGAASGGSPISMLPRDPIGNAGFHYAYKADDTNKTFELNGRLESVKYRPRMTIDGGNQNTCTTFEEATCWYEIGTDPDLNL